MINQKTPLTVLHDDNGEFLDYSIDAASFGRDAFSLPLVAAQDGFYLGFRKPFSVIFVEMALGNGQQVSFLARYWDGSGWSIADNLIDDTKGFARSGFLQWDRPANGAWKANEVNGKELYWLKLEPDADFSDDLVSPEADPQTPTGPMVQGINILFSDDQDLKAVYPAIMNLLEEEETSFVLRHETARDDIVQFVRNSGVMKTSAQLGVHAQIEAWDLLIVEEVRAWSKYLALANIFSGVQSKENGMWKQKADEYSEKAENAKAAFYLSLDKNDDGVADPNEVMARIDSVRLVRR